MSVELAEPRTTRRNNDTVVRIDAEAVRLAKIVAAYDGKSLARFLSDLVFEQSSAMLRQRQEAGVVTPVKKLTRAAE